MGGTLDICGDAFDPFASRPGGPVANSFSYEITDIRRGTQREFYAYERGFPSATCWASRLRFQAHSGEPFVGKQRALNLFNRRECAT